MKEFAVHNANKLIVLEWLIKHHSETCLNYVLWHVDPLLGNDREIGNCTAAVARQWSVNNNRRTVFSARSAKQQLSSNRGTEFTARYVLRCVISRTSL
jgi:hypothetical protein